MVFMLMRLCILFVFVWFEQKIHCKFHFITKGYKIECIHPKRLKIAFIHSGHDHSILIYNIF